MPTYMNMDLLQFCAYDVALAKNMLKAIFSYSLWLIQVQHMVERRKQRCLCAHERTSVAIGTVHALDVLLCRWILHHWDWLIQSKKWCCIHGGAAAMEVLQPWRCCSHGGAAAMEVLQPWRCCSHGGAAAMEELQPWKCCSHGGAAAMEVLQPWRCCSHCYRPGDM